MKSQTTMILAAGTKISSDEIACLLTRQAGLLNKGKLTIKTVSVNSPKIKKSRKPGLGLIGKACYKITVARLMFLRDLKSNFKICKKIINAAWD